MIDLNVTAMESLLHKGVNYAEKESLVIKDAMEENLESTEESLEDTKENALKNIFLEKYIFYNSAPGED
jgi:hypothetical protein